MRLALWFLLLAVLVLGTWMIWGGKWEDQFTLDGSVIWLKSSGQWAWLFGIILLVVDLALPVPSTIVISALGYIYGVMLGGAIASVGLIASGLFGYGAGRFCMSELLGAGSETATMRTVIGYSQVVAGGWLLYQKRCPLSPRSSLVRPALLGCHSSDS